MWMKTALKRVCKLCPISIEMMAAIGLDDQYEAGVARVVDLDAPDGTKAHFGFTAKAEAADKPKAKAKKAAPAPEPPPEDVTGEPELAEDPYYPVPDDEAVPEATP
jgi:recombinational DNA repair protein RecT